MGGQERFPGRSPASLGSRFKALVEQDALDRVPAEGVTKVPHGPTNARVAPTGILVRHLDHQRHKVELGAPAAAPALLRAVVFRRDDRCQNGTVVRRPVGAAASDGPRITIVWLSGRRGSARGRPNCRRRVRRGQKLGTVRWSALVCPLVGVTLFLHEQPTRRASSAHSMRATFITTTLATAASLEEVRHAQLNTAKVYDRRGGNLERSPNFFANY